MRRLHLRLLPAIFLLITIPLFSQVETGEYDKDAVVKRLSYENFRNLKMLQTAIRNYGGGEEKIKELIDQYSEASALNFQGKTTESAEMFLQNERAILKAAQEIVAQYKKDTDAIFVEGTKYYVQHSFEKRMKENEDSAVVEKLVSNAKFSLKKASDIHDRYINATTASASELIHSIYYYRRTKENVFTMYDYIKRNLESGTSPKDEDEAKERKDRIEELEAKLEKYEKDIQDNANKVYVSKEKSN